MIAPSIRCALATTVLISACATANTPEAVALDDLGDDRWQLFVDDQVDSELVGFIEALTGEDLGISPQRLDNAWLRSWVDDDNFLLILASKYAGALTEDGFQAIADVVDEALAGQGFLAVDVFDDIPGTITIDVSDPVDPGLLVLVPKEQYLVVIVTGGSVEEAELRQIVERQIAAIPAYDATERYRPFFIGVTGLAFVVLLAFAIRSSRKPRQQPNGEEWSGPSEDQAE